MSNEGRIGIRMEIILGSELTRRFNKKHHKKTGEVQIYIPNSGWMAEHRFIAREVVGKPLSKKIEVHHLDGNPSNNTHGNLVICQDHRYHMLLHNRAKCLRAGQPMDYRRCSKCNSWFHESHYYQKSGQYILATCRKCLVEYTRGWVNRNPERAKALDKRWKEKNADKVRTAKTAYMKRWRAANPDRVKAIRDRGREKAGHIGGIACQ